MNLLLDNLKIEKYNFSLELEDNNIYVVYGNDSNLISKFLLYVAGINKVKEGKVLFNGEDVFDQSEYFLNRIYIDMRIKYINSLSPSVIKANVSEKFNVEFDEAIFKKNIGMLNVRKEVKFNGKYIYSNLGNSLVNYCFLSSIKSDNYIINNLFYNIESSEHKEKIVADIININNKGKIISVDELDLFINKPVKYIIFGDYGEALLIDPKKDKFIITKDDLELKNRLFKLENGEVICHVDGNDFLKKGFFRRIKYKEITFDNIIKYRRKSILNYEKVRA